MCYFRRLEYWGFAYKPHNGFLLLQPDTNKYRAPRQHFRSPHNHYVLNKLVFVLFNSLIS